MESTNPFADAPLPAPGPRLESASDPLNPYAAPAGPEENEFPGPGVGIWRHQDFVVIHQSLDLPTRCIFTNEASLSRHDTTFHWSAWFGLSQGSIKFNYSLSNACGKQKLRSELWSLGLCLAGGASLLAGFALSNAMDELVTGLSSLVSGFALLFGLLLLVSGWVRYRQHSSPLALVYRHDPYFVLSGAREPFLRSLPAWPGLKPR